MADAGGDWQPGDSLDAVEEEILGHVARGVRFDGKDAAGRSHDPGQGRSGRAAISIRAGILRHLLTAPDWPVDARGVRLRRVRIRGVLDLDAATVRCPLVLDDCDLDRAGPLIVDRARIPLLALMRCRLPGISGDALAVDGNLNLARSEVSGLVVLSGARVDGALLCHGAAVSADGRGRSMICAGMNVRLTVHLSEGFTTDGAVVMERSVIGGELVCRDAHLGRRQQDKVSLDARGIRVAGAAFFGGLTTEGSVSLSGASIGGQVSCDGASIGADMDQGSLLCDGMRAGGSVHLDRARAGAQFRAAGAVRLAGAEITGSLTCRGAVLGANGYGNSLIADELKVSVAMLVEDGSTAQGAIRIPGADIGGQLRLSSAEISGSDKSGYSLVADRARISGAAYLDEGFVCAGGVGLPGAEISGMLSLAGARLGGAGPDHLSFAGDGIKVGRDLVLRGADCAGVTQLAGAVIGGALAGQDVRLGADTAQQNSLIATRLRAGGDVVFDGAAASGAVIMAGARIGGMLSLASAAVSANSYGNALNCNGARIGRDIALNTIRGQQAFTARGTIRMAGAEITGSLHCEGAQLSAGASGSVLIADGIKVGGTIFLTSNFIADGAIRLSQATVSGSFRLGGAILRPAGSDQALLAEQSAIAGGVYMNRGFTAAGDISLRGTSIQGELCWEPAAPVTGEVNLEGAAVRYLVDNWASPRTAGYWPLGRMRLVGFTYRAFAGDHQATAAQRLDWVRSQYQGSASPSSPHGSPLATVPQRGRPPFATQPYRHLADVYRSAGQDDDARIVEITLRRDLRKYGDLARPRRAVNWLLDVTIRYGYETRRALAGLAALYLLAFLASLAAQHQGDLIVATNVYNPALHPTALRCVSGYPCFYPAGYAFDLVVPLINIHQADFWHVNGHHWLGWIWVAGTWVITACGWFLATLLVVGYTGLARQQ